MESLKTRLQLPYLPPSANHIWRHTKRAGKPVTYVTKEYKTWLNAVGWLSRAGGSTFSGNPEWNTPVYITIAMRRPRQNADIDNRIKPILDMLQRFKFLENDKLVEGVNAFWSRSLPEAVAVDITITPAQSPFEKAA